MKSEQASNLEGRSILLVESGAIVGVWAAEASWDWGVKHVEERTSIPTDLVGFMEERMIESAIVHPDSVRDEVAIVAAVEAGKRIILLERYPVCTKEEAEMYQRLHALEIPSVPKTGPNCWSDSLVLLSMLMENQS